MAVIVSLMLSVNPALTPAQVRSILQQTAVDLGAPGKDNQFGFGLVDPVAALRAVGASRPGGPVLLVSTDNLDFGSQLTRLSVALSNAGGGTLSIESVAVETDQGGNWLSATLFGNTLRVRVDRSGLPRNHFSGRIRIRSNGGNAVIQVSMQVARVVPLDIGTVLTSRFKALCRRTTGQRK